MRPPRFANSPTDEFLFWLADRLGHADPRAMAATMPSSVLTEWSVWHKRRQAKEARARQQARRR